MATISGRKKMQAAIDSLLAGDHWFYGSESVSKKWVEDDKIPTLCTDGTGVIRYNPRYIESISFDNTVFCVVHENDHDILMHPLRAAELDMDMEVANIAADIVVNLREITAGFVPPRGVIHRPEFEGWSFDGVYEEIYPEVVRERKQKVAQQQGQSAAQQKSPDDGSGDPGKCGGFTRPKNESGKDMDKAELAELERGIVARVVSNSQATSVAGMMPGWLREVIRTVKNPEVPWQSVLERFVTERARNDYSWEQLDEEYLQRGLFVPSLDSKMIGEIIFGRDASGSITDGVYNQFTVEAQEILDRIQPEILRIINFSDVVEGDFEYRPGDKIEVGERSAGGTMFQPVFDHVRERGYQPACMVILTDMDSADRPRDPGYPVLWVSCGSKKAPFGEMVRIRR